CSTGVQISSCEVTRELITSNVPLWKATAQRTTEAATLRPPIKKTKAIPACSRRDCMPREEMMKSGRMRTVRSVVMCKTKVMIKTSLTRADVQYSVSGKIVL